MYTVNIFAIRINIVTLFEPFINKLWLCHSSKKSYITLAIANIVYIYTACRTRIYYMLLSHNRWCKKKVKAFIETESIVTR